jgi:2-(1,2-epoxy-1,2-dihydrophenyl)acetyl-CoA isomerase
MKNQIILEKTKGPCRTIILNRPEVHNAFNFELAEALESAVRDAAADSKIRVVVLRGAGKAFSAGGDLKLFQKNLQASEAAFKQISAHLNEVIRMVTTMSKPVLAAVRGPAYAAGFGVAVSCDMVLASHNAKLSPSFINIALSPNAASTFFLPRLIGPKRAMEAFFRGEVFSATEAKNLGIVNHVWSEARFETELDKLVQELANRPTLSLGRIKKLLTMSYAQNFHDQLDLERDEIAASSLSEDFKEGVHAFVGKRKPKFQGK